MCIYLKSGYLQKVPLFSLKKFFHAGGCKRISLKEDKIRLAVMLRITARPCDPGGGVLNITLEQLQAMKSSTYEPVNRDDLVDIRDVKINQALPVTDRILQFIALTKNPYLYKYGDKVVRISFAETEVTFEERMKGYFEML